MSDESMLPGRWTEEDLILHFYGEHPEAAALAAALAADAELRARWERLQRVLAIASPESFPVPDPGAGFEARLWRRVAPRPRRAAPAMRWALAAGLAGLIAGAFLLGRGSQPGPDPGTLAGSLAPEAQERILRAALARHLERVERLFVDVEHGRAVAAASGPEDEAPARELLQDNRLFRSTLDAERDGRLVRVLEEIEPLLTELAHAAGGEPAAPELRDRLRERDFLFKLRVVLRRLHGEPERPAAPRALL
jgi:hypothetical protein